MFTRSVTALVAVLALAGCGAPAQETPPGVALPADSIVTDTPSRDDPPATQPPAVEPRISEPPAAEPPPFDPGQQRRRPVARPVKPEGAVALVVRRVKGFGRIVVDGEGFVLYRFDGDAPNRASCTGPCNDLWAPVLGNNVAPSGGIDKIDLGIVERPDKSHQITLGGAPLYRFTGDTAPGQVNGHGAGEQSWWAVAADGSRATKQSEAGET